MRYRSLWKPCAPQMDFKRHYLHLFQSQIHRYSCSEKCVRVYITLFQIKFGSMCLIYAG